MNEKSVSKKEIVKKLEEKGYIKKGSSKNRTIEVLVPNEYIEKDENVEQESCNRK